MSQSDFFLFDAYAEQLGEKIHNLESDTFKLALIKSQANGGDDPAQTDADPRWGAGGTINFATAEVTAGGNYTAGGASLAGANNTFTLAAAIATFDSTDNPTWAQHASNPTNARWAILYNDTDTGKHVIGYIDLGSDFDMTTGDLTNTWNASGIHTVTRA